MALSKKAMESSTGAEKECMCELCLLHDGNIRPATMYCVDCVQLLCQSCVHVHRKFRMIRAHRLLDIQAEKHITQKQDERIHTSNTFGSGVAKLQSPSTSDGDKISVDKGDQDHKAYQGSQQQRYSYTRHEGPSTSDQTWLPPMTEISYPDLVPESLKLPLLVVSEDHDYTSTRVTRTAKERVERKYIHQLNHPIDHFLQDNQQDSHTKSKQQEHEEPSSSQQSRPSTYNLSKDSKGGEGERTKLKHEPNNEVTATLNNKHTDNFEQCISTPEKIIMDKNRLLTSVRQGDHRSVCEMLSSTSKDSSISEKHVKEALRISISLSNRNIANELLKFASKMLKQNTQLRIKDVWPAYKESSEWEPIFVVMSEERFAEERYLGYKVLWRHCDLVSREASIVANSTKVRENPLSYEDMESMKKIIKTANLFRNHKNITVVNVCPCKSRQGGKDIALEKCIVICTSVKGLIPFEEQPFPKHISNIPVDVREALVTLGMNGDGGKVRGLYDRRRSRRNNFTTNIFPAESFSPTLHKHNAPETNTAHNDSESVVNICRNGNTANDTSSIQNDIRQLSIKNPRSSQSCSNPQSNTGKSVHDIEEDRSSPMDTTTQTVPNHGKKSCDVNDQLLMGTEIRLLGNNFCGTLGAFVPLPNGELGALTCAHVMGVYSGEYDADTTKVVIQPSVETSSEESSLRSFSVGHLYKAAFDQGCRDDVSIDAAVVKIQDRIPQRAEFIETKHSRLKSAGFEPWQPPSFAKGEILTYDQIRRLGGRRVIKYGSQTGLTKGLLDMWGTDIRAESRQMMLPDCEKVEFFNQIEVASIQGYTQFFDAGDSGSLVFMPRDDHGPELYCIGLAIGWTSYHSCIVTPIENVFEKLGLPAKFMDFSNP